MVGPANEKHQAPTNRLYLFMNSSYFSDASQNSLKFHQIILEKNTRKEIKNLTKLNHGKTLILNLNSFYILKLLDFRRFKHIMFPYDQNN